MFVLPRGATRLQVILIAAALTLLIGGVAWYVDWADRAEAFDRERVYTIGFGSDAPLHFPDENGNPTGLAVEIVREAARRQGIKLNWVNQSRMRSDDDTQLWVLKSIRPWHTSRLHHTEPYLQAESCFLVRRESPIGDLPDLEGARISYVDYAIHRETLPQILGSFQPRPRKNSPAAVDALLAGEADAAYVDQYALFSTLLSGEKQALRVLPTRSPTRDMALAAEQPYAAVADEIRAGMQSMAVDGSLDTLMKRWIFFPNMTANIIGDIAAENRRARGLLWGTGGLIVLLLASLALSVLAQRRKSALRSSERKYRELHESMTDAYARFDRKGRIEATNPAFAEMLGYADDQLLGRSEADLTPPAWHEADRERLATQVRERGFSEVYEKEYRRADGSVFPAECRAFLLRDDAGRAIGHWAIVRDITERKRAEADRAKLEEQLLQSQKMEVVGRLAGGVAHDFNNMLQAIQGNTALALLDAPAEGPLREHIEEIRGAAARSAELTRQLLAFARRQTISPRVLDLNGTIEDTLKLLRRLIGEAITLTWRPGRQVGTVRLDPSQFDQILTNLCVNARDAIGGAGEISLETRAVQLDPDFCRGHPGLQPGRFVRLSVRDNGSGIPEEARQHLFEPFYTTKGVGQGTGLGLATIYGIIVQNNGLITVESEPGEGTTFHVHLPRHSDAETNTPSPTAPPAAPLGGPETILLVEDDPAVERISRKLLTGMGYRVLSATGPDDALSLAQAHSGEIDLLLTDVIMPGLNGRELADKLRARQPDLRCVFMSGYDANVIAPHGVLADEVHFIQKPFPPEKLAAAVRAALEKPPRRGMEGLSGRSPADETGYV